MNASNSNSILNAQIYEEASEWLVLFRTAQSEAEECKYRQQLDEWLRRSPEHVRAYLEVSAIWEDVALHDSKHAIDAESHIARARAEGNVVTMPASLGANALPAAPEIKREAPKNTRTTRRWQFAIAASVTMLVVGGIAGLSLLNKGTYVTGIGEQRSITLADGSAIDLNARSKVRVRYSRNARDIYLLDGQALFQVAKDVRRPFTVHSGAATVRALGTQFDVYRKNVGTRVTVVEGRVAVTASPKETEPAGSAVELGAGQQVTVERQAQRIPHPVRANVLAATAWVQRRLVFDSAPLGDVAEEFNRYNERPLIVRDPVLRDFAVVGVFSSTDPASLLRFLREQPGIRVIEGDRQITIARQ